MKVVAAISLVALCLWHGAAAGQVVGGLPPFSGTANSKAGQAAGKEAAEAEVLRSARLYTEVGPGPTSFIAVPVQAVPLRENGLQARCVGNPVPASYEAKTGVVSGVPVVARTRLDGVALPVRLLLLADPATVPEGPPEQAYYLCLPPTVALNDKRQLVLEDLYRQNNASAIMGGMGSIMMGGIGGLLGGISGIGGKFQLVFGSPLEELLQVQISSTPPGATVMRGNNATRYRTDKMLGLTESDLRNLWLKVGDKAKRLRECERQSGGGTADVRFHCKLQ